MFQCFVITWLKWMRYKYKLTFPYYSITFWDLKSLQSVPKTWQVLKTKKKFFKKMSKYRNTVFYDFKSRFLVLFSSNYRHRLVLKIPFPDYIFPKISKYRSENLHFPSNGKYYAPLKKKVFLKISQSSQENTGVGVSFSIKLLALCLQLY